MSTHTPGPWIFDRNSDVEFNVIADTGRSWKWVATTTADGEGSTAIIAEEAEANARLIAAAPAFALAWSMVPDEIRQRIFDALHKPDTEWAEAAIAKATGQQ